MTETSMVSPHQTLSIKLGTGHPQQQVLIILNRLEVLEKVMADKIKVKEVKAKDGVSRSEKKRSKKKEEKSRHSNTKLIKWQGWYGCCWQQPQQRFSALR